MNIYSDLVRAQVENLSTDPTASVDLPVGRIWRNSGSDVFKYVGGDGGDVSDIYPICGSPVSLGAYAATANIDATLAATLMQTITGNVAYTFTNWATSTGSGKILCLDVYNSAGSDYTATFTPGSGSTIVWPGGAPITDVFSATHTIFTFVKMGTVILATAVTDMR